LAEINHSAFSLSSSVTKTNQTIVEQLTTGIQTYLEELQGQAEEKVKTTVKIQNRIQKNRGYNVEDLIRNSIEAEEAKKQAETEKKEQKEQLQIERQLKKEQKEQEKQERKRKRDEKKEEKRIQDQERERRRNTNTCKANCGKTCRIGHGWKGCKVCDEFWMCPECFQARKHKRAIQNHEKVCGK
jgi:hypothetical protein